MYRDIEIKNDWLISDAVAIDDDVELWEALVSAELCPQSPLSPAVTITASSHGEHFMHDYM